MASTTAGGEWPKQLTAQPWMKSRYRLPLWSQSQEPSPLTNTIGGRGVICMSACVAYLWRFINRFFRGLGLVGTSRTQELRQQQGCIRRQADRRAKSSEAPNVHITAPEACRARMMSFGPFSSAPRAIAAQ